MSSPSLPVILSLVSLALVPGVRAYAAPAEGAQDTIATRVAAEAAVPPVRAAAVSAAERVTSTMRGRYDADLEAMTGYRPGFRFWQHIFNIPDGSIAFGSATDGRLLAVFPARGNWNREGTWGEPAFRRLIAGASLPRSLSDRRDEVALILEKVAGPIVHNPTRGQFVAPNAARYGRFLDQWGAIYERFGVPADLGLAQGLVESGLNGSVRSEARAIGFCQWLMSNWNHLKSLSPHVIEGYNQTTQAPYCAAYLSILATKYGSFIPALSEHHAGGTNVGRTIDNGRRLGGGQDVRDYYFLGAAFTRDLRTIAPRSYTDVYGTYGPRSYFYSEMIFGNMDRVKYLKQTTRQSPIHAMRTTRAFTLAEIASRTKLSTDEIRRYNPALVKRVPARATLYLPRHVPAFGADVAFWRRPAPAAYSAVLADFLALDHAPAEWDLPEFVPVLRGFERRFRDTRCEEGTVMATVLSYIAADILTSGRGAILEEFRTSETVRQLFEEAVLERNAARGLTQ